MDRRVELKKPSHPHNFFEMGVSYYNLALRLKTNIKEQQRTKEQADRRRMAVAITK